MQKTLEFLKKTGTYYLATVEDDQPRVRPFGTIHKYEDKLYIQTGKIKDIYSQLTINPKAEICAFDGQTWVRIECELINDDRDEVSESLLGEYPDLRAMYTPGDDNCTVFYIKNAVATFYSFTGEPTVEKF
ncbi:MAG: pyridoxamine 5'-phosphate oxidase family protein [Ruminococcus sp.]|jgi:uncharacterized pyridoxamine 5'-phosphate oxidase family protein|nr:pyridoxamine 5'-phosphate oxidase family protein [Ruminococcus sp.]